MPPPSERLQWQAPALQAGTPWAPDASPDRDRRAAPPSPSRDTPPLRAPPPSLSAAQAALITLCQFTEAIHTTLPYTLAVYLVRDLLSGASESAVGAATGALAASWCASQFLTSVAWGRAADAIGRKPLILISAAASGVSVIFFATAPSVGAAAAARIAGGALNSTFVSLKCMLGECAPSGPSQARGMSLLALGWGLGTLIGPATGGLSHPCSSPRVASLLPASVCTPSTGLFVVSPFLLPALVAASVSALTFVLAALFLVETLPASARRQRACAGAGRVLKSKTGDQWEVGAATPTPPGEVELAVVTAESAPLLAGRGGQVAPLSPFGSKAARGEQPAPSSTTPPPWHTHRPALWALAGYGSTAFLFNLVDELLPLWASAPPSVGGLGLSPAALAAPLAVGGAALIAWSQLGYIHLQKAVGARRTAKLGLGWAAPLVALLPLPSALPAAVAVPTLALLLAARSIVANNAFTSSMILVNTNAPPGRLGPVNGAGQTLASAARAVGPALGGVLWAGAAVTPLVGQWLPFALVAALCVASTRVFDHVSPPLGEGGEVVAAAAASACRDDDAPLAPLSPER